jgi:hypothetical protein
MVFNIGSQSGGVFNNVAGDQTVYGGQWAVAGSVSLDDARAAARELRGLLDRHARALAPQDASAVRRHLDAADRELARSEPDRPRVAERLRRLTEVVVSAGALAAAGTAFGAPLMALAGWLGPLGDPIRRLLGGGS